MLLERTAQRNKELSGNFFYVFENNITKEKNVDNITFGLLKKHLGDEINSLASINNSYHYELSIKKRTLQKFVDALERNHYNIISGLDQDMKEMFYMNQICSSFYRYNELFLQISHESFRSKILYPNLIYILFRFYTSLRKFIQKTINGTYNEVKLRNGSMINKYVNSYYLDEEIIKSDALFAFLGNSLRKTDPLDILNKHTYYRSVFRNIFHYYFRGNQKYRTNFSNFIEMDSFLGNNINIPVELMLYRDILYSLQIEKFCKTSPTMYQISYNYNIFKNIILDNEIQNMYLSTKKDIFLSDNNHYKLMEIYNDDMKMSSNTLEEIKKLPVIYKLLRSVRIINNNSSPYNELRLKPAFVKECVLEELYKSFKNIFSDHYVYQILERVSQNFVDSILKGEYINLLTLSDTRIDQPSFTNQLKKFVSICINEVRKI